MIKGIGTDIIEIERIKANCFKDKFINRVFTVNEIDYCNNKANPEVHYAGRFAAKEAVLKAIGTGLRGLKWTDIEILPDELGVPIVYLGIEAAKIAEKRGVSEILVSISHCQNYAVAYATAI